MNFEQRARYELNTLFHDFHPLAKNFWFISQCVVFGSSVGYLVIVAVLSLIMRRQKPVPEQIMRPVVSAYNMVQIAFNSIIFIVTTSSIVSRSTFESVLCLPLSPLYKSSSSYAMLDVWESYGNWLFFVNKYVELLDTLWIILRKRFNQLSFLHVYHHSTVLIVFWPIASYIPSGVSTWNSMLNSGVHVLMYSYYFLTSRGSQYQQRLRTLKPYLTRIQISQFMFLIVVSCLACYHIHITRTCRHSMLYGLFMNIYGFSLLALFGYFYRSSYRRKDKEN
ncbi:very long chain fatty acid elongase 7-like isoform X2 [Convolutriloba macropyga]